MEPEDPLPYANIPPSLPILRLINSVHCTYPPTPISSRSILLYSPISTQIFQVTSFIQNLPTKMLYAPLLSPICSTCLAHLILLDLITQIIFGEKYTPWRSVSCDFLQFTVTSSLLGPNVFFSTLLSITLNPYSSLNLRHQDEQTYTAPHKLYCCVF